MIIGWKKDIDIILLLVVISVNKIGNSVNMKFIIVCIVFFVYVIMI